MTSSVIALDELGVDPGTPGFFLRPDYYDVLARLRVEAPVFEYAPGIKAVTRYRDIRDISRNVRCTLWSASKVTSGVC